MIRLSLVSKRTDAIVSAIETLWERSVRATHSFLSEQDIVDIRPAVGEGVRGIQRLVCAYDGTGALVGFMGVEGDEIVMLFVEPQRRGKGIGTRLVRCAEENFSVRYVDVNEQNPEATGFYEHLGFHIYKRSPLDGQGRPFPILHLRKNERV